MKIPLALLLALSLPAVALVACGGSAPAADSTGPAPAPATEPTGAAPAPSPAADPAPAAATGGEQYLVTPTDKLKKLTKNDLTAASKLAKGEDPWDAALAQIQAKLGPATYVWKPAPDPESAIDETHYWSVPIADGGCEQFWLQRAGKGSPWHPNVLDLGLKTISKNEATMGDMNAPNACTGGPKK